MQSMNASISHIDESNELIAHDPNVYIQDFVITSSYIVLEVRKNGLPAISQYKKDSLLATDIMLPDTSYFVSLASLIMLTMRIMNFIIITQVPIDPLLFIKQMQLIIFPLRFGKK
jgi:protease II